MTTLNKESINYKTDNIDTLPKQLIERTCFLNGLAVAEIKQKPKRKDAKKVCYCLAYFFRFYLKLPTSQIARLLNLSESMIIQIAGKLLNDGLNQDQRFCYDHIKGYIYKEVYNGQ